MILKNFFKFQEALAESMNDVKQKVTNTIDHMNSVVKREPRSNKLRKYIHVKTKEEFAFKTVNIRHINEV